MGEKKQIASFFSGRYYHAAAANGKNHQSYSVYLSRTAGQTSNSVQQYPVHRPALNQITAWQ
jgi:hypothetical protein